MTRVARSKRENGWYISAHENYWYALTSLMFYEDGHGKKFYGSGVIKILWQILIFLPPMILHVARN
jgi:hypothetical protein